MLVAPDTFNPIDHPEWNRDRTNRIKALVAGKYKPKGLMDQYYGKLPEDLINAGLPPASYFDESAESKQIKENRPDETNTVDPKKPRG